MSRSIPTSVALPVDLLERLDRLHALEQMERPEVSRSAVLRLALRSGIDALETAKLAMNPGSQP